MPGEKHLLKSLFDKAVDAAQAGILIPGSLPPAPTGTTIVVGAGKAAAAMACAIEENWPGDLRGLVSVPYGHSLACDQIEVVEAAHPVPDEAGANAARRVMAMVQGLSADDLVLCLLSGGGSSLLSIPAGGVSLGEKQALTGALLKSGADIAEINCVRKHLSAIKGGQLAVACFPAQVVTMAISDVVGDDASVIASGPTVPDPTTSKMALDVLRKFDITATDNVMAQLRNPASETPKPGDSVFDNTEYLVLATAADAMAAAEEAAREHGVEPLILGELEGDATKLAIEHADLARKTFDGSGPVNPPCVLISGGETTVQVRGNGRGGRNSEYSLALALALDGHPGIHAIACDTDGIDGTEDNAGCYVTPDSLERAERLSLNAKDLLQDNDSYYFFSETGGLIVTGPTRTNVNDFRAILIAGH